MQQRGEIAAAQDGRCMIVSWLSAVPHSGPGLEHCAYADAERSMKIISEVLRHAKGPMYSLSTTTHTKACILGTDAGS
jgi:hypothetical protein